MNVCLISMPYANIAYPSIALGTLQAILQNHGITVKSFYGNMLFAEQIGFDNYTKLSEGLYLSPLAGWTFSHIAFPDFQPDNDKFISQLQKHPRYRDQEFDDIKKFLQEMRNEAARCVDLCAQKILEYNPSIVGCASTYSQHVSSLAVLRRIRELNPAVISIMGGADCEGIMGYSTHKFFPWVDYVVSGEADDIIVPLITNILAEGKNLGGNLISKGVFAPIHRINKYSDINQESIDRAVTENLEHLPVPYYDDYFSTLETTPHIKQVFNPFLMFESSRGCWWAQNNPCTFCGLNGQYAGFRCKSAPKVIAQLAELHCRYGIASFFFTDNILNMNYFDTLIPQLKDYNYSIFYEVKANLKEIHIKALREAGITCIQPGIESLHSEILSLMNKGLYTYQVIQLLKWCRQYGVYMIWFILYNFPAEDDKHYLEMAEYLPLLAHLQPPDAMMEVIFQRYSEYHTHAKDYGLKLQPPTIFTYVYPLAAEELQDVVYFFDEEHRLQLRENKFLQLLIPYTGRRVVYEYVQEWKKEFYSNEPYVLSMAVTGEALHIRDSRPVATAPSITLTGMAAKIYVACNEAKTIDKLYKLFATKEIEKSIIHDIAEKLVKQKIMIKVDDRFLSLAVSEPFLPLPKREGEKFIIKKFSHSREQ